MRTTLSAYVATGIKERIEALALRFSREMDRPVSASEVTEILLEAGLERHPVDEGDEDLVRARSGERPGRRRPKPQPRLTVVDGQAREITELYPKDESDRTIIRYCWPIPAADNGADRQGEPYRGAA